MNKPARSRWLPITLALFVCLMVSGTELLAQDQTNQSSPTPDAQQSQPTSQQPQDQQPQAQTPDPAAQPTPGAQGQQAAPDSQAGQEQVFSGTIVKIGDKYQLQDASGKSYDMDRQDLAQKYVGTQVRVKGSLDPDGKTIHVK